ncbi:hypothetical protein SAMN05216573_12255 [Bradyrhizobium sp. Rc3b]|nr:hypothetical protein SAMN05216573_12255 [Bradyrhizobium sp. Rc3b]
MDRHGAAFRVVMRTRPTTPAGLAALTSWVLEEANDMLVNESHWFSHDLCALAATLDDAVRGISKLEPWSLPYRKAANHGLDDASSLEDRNAVVEAEVGQDPDEYTDEAASAFWQAADDLFDIKPTTLARVVAFLRFADDLGDSNKTLLKAMR